MSATHTLRAIAISAPHWPVTSRTHSERHLNSTMPFSLLNALRVSLSRAQSGSGAWSGSNWSDFADRSRSIFTSDYLSEAMQWVAAAIDKYRPHLLFIGSMTLSFPGAIEIARYAKSRLGNRSLIVLGGKHVNETVYVEDGLLKQHRASAFKLMHERKIPLVFDVLISGDGEELIAELGEVVAQVARDSPENLRRALAPEFQRHLLKARGNWGLFWTQGDAVRWLHQTGVPLDYNSMPYAGALYPVTSRFAVFDRDITAHAYSDTGKGCIYSCHFCSEGAHINGKIIQMSSAAGRLARQFEIIAELGRRHRKSVSAFVEDSILLQGKVSALQNLHDYLKRHPIDLVFGGQFTIDGLLDRRRQEAIQQLRETGLTYVFVGLETGDETIARSMSKNRYTHMAADGSTTSWMQRTSLALTFLDEARIDAGVSILFGLGEMQGTRVKLLKTLKAWQQTCGQPKVVSMNWAVQHPLRGLDSSRAYDYFEWGTQSDSPVVHHLATLFGEASERYCLPGVQMASLDELEEIAGCYAEIRNCI